MPEYQLAIYNAFSDTTFGGSAAGLIDDAKKLEAEQMQRIAREIGAPATCFVTDIFDDSVDVRFFSTLTEYGMCGHGTIGLMTWLVDQEYITLDPGQSRAIDLRTPEGIAEVDIRCRLEGRVEVMLTLAPATFESSAINSHELAPLFGISSDSLASGLPIELTRSDFTHLIVPAQDLTTLQKLVPDFGAITSLCQAMQIDTIALFTTETVLAESTIHCREFCPAVGTPEAPASGTTNRALACYLLQQGLLDAASESQVVIAEQGYEIDKPSRICTELTLQDGQAIAVKVGGVATKILQGSFYIS